jgi:early secretory antigenic target protein ESAT-6
MLVKVSFGSMNTGISDIGNAHSTLQALFDELQQRVDELGQSWDGPAHQAYLAAQQQWNAMDRKLNVGLQNLGGGVRKANTTFQAAEQRNRAVWNS